MLLVFENNPQFFNPGDGFKLFNDHKVGASYALNRGFTNPYVKGPDDIVRLLDAPGKGLSGSSTGAPIIVKVIATVDGAVTTNNLTAQSDAEATQKLQAQVTDLSGQLTDLQGQLALAQKDNSDLNTKLAKAQENVEALETDLDESDKKVSSLQDQLKTLTPAAPTAPVTDTPAAEPTTKA